MKPFEPALYPSSTGAITPIIPGSFTPIRDIPEGNGIFSPKVEERLFDFIAVLL
ncbi:hypothetical protein [Burkholderia sp. S-53]|uniref:hypothetical protein n=1 Tax=Burkholderia sp. S-53 TaxID=2906514 RepID=UPI0021D39712|nr:hypothetical protein [Burkholderia sp. S-53]UXU90017.1 hypothetical protein LXM88_32355 [Burkholderia sp. S-53]